MTVTKLKQLLKQIGLRPDQAAGQNFLLDETIAEQMVSAAGVSAGETVLEIGPGLGILTEALLNAGAEVIGVELDRRLAGYLQHHFAAHPGFQLVQNDIFRVNLNEHVHDGDYQLVANLPYSSTALVFRNFLTLVPRPNSLTVMVQREVAHRITARPGDLSTLAVMVQYYSQVERLFDVPAQKFYPVPAVESSVIHCHHLRPVQPSDKKLFQVVRAGFSSRRKLLANSLAGSLRLPVAKVSSGLRKIGLSATARAQEIPVEIWPKIAKLVS